MFKSRKFSLTLCFALLVTLFPLGSFADGSVTTTKAPTDELVHINIMHTNDMHGFYVEGSSDGMGAAKLQTVINMVKQANPNTLLLDAGDAIQGHSLVTLNKGENGIKILNELKYDAMALGNHEFDYSAAKLAELRGKANFPMLAANVKTADGKLFAGDHIIKEVNGVKIGIFGITTPETLYMTHPDNVKGMKFEDPTETAKKEVETLKKMGATVIVCLAHLGDESQIASSDILAKNTKGIDIIIDGHSHSTYAEGKLVNGVLIASTGEKTKNLGILDLTVKNGKIKTKRAGLFTKAASKDIKEDTAVATLVKTLNDANKTILDEVVATSPVALVGDRAKVRAGETNLGNMITASLLDISKADVALVNGGGIRTSIDKGPVTKGEVLAVLPFGNTVRVIEIKGSDLLAALEVGIDTYPTEKGAFPHIGGMSFTFDSKKPAGKRVVSAMVGTAPVDPEKTYKLATNDFIAAGGDGYVMLKGKKVVAEYGTMDQILIEYMNLKGFDAAPVTNRIKDISAAASWLLEKIAA